jgi:ankyrin repeat protein
LQCVILLLDRGADPNAATTAEPGESVEARTLVSAVTRAGLSSNTAVYWLLLQRGGAARALDNISKNVSQRLPEGESMIQAYTRAFSSTEMRDLFAMMRENLRLNPAPPNHLSFADFYDRGAALAAMGPEAQDLAARGFGLFMKHGLKLTNNPKGPDSETPLHRIAISGGSIEMAKVLLEGGADPNVTRPDGRTPYELAVRHGNAQVAELLRSHGASADAVRPIDRLLGACIRNDRETANAILAAQPGLANELDLEDCEAIVRLAGRNKLDTMRMMAGLGFHLTSRGESGSTPLHVAAWHGYPDMVRLLLDNGAPVNARDATYDTSPLSWAAHGSRNCRSADEDYCSVVATLIDAGADYPSAVNHWGVGPEQVCTPAVQKVIARLL